MSLNVLLLVVHVLFTTLSLIAAQFSIVGRQRNESSNAKELLQDRRRMAGLFKDIAVYSRDELEHCKQLRNKISLDAIISFFQNGKDEFVTLNFLSGGMEEHSTAMVVCACFYYAVSSCRLFYVSCPTVDTETTVSLQLIDSLMNE